jgi:hypothetical protein
MPAIAIGLVEGLAATAECGDFLFPVSPETSGK